MKRFGLCLFVAAVLIGTGVAGATPVFPSPGPPAPTSACLVWDFSTPSDYYVDGDSGTVPNNVNYLPVITAGAGAYVPARPYVNSDDDAYGSDWAAVFARLNTQPPLLKIDDITGGGFTLTGMNHPDAVYGSLYLSPTGGGGSTVMINISPMGRTGAGGSFEYDFDLDTLCDVKVGAPNWGTAQYTGTFGGAIDWVNSSAYSGTYAAFFGPQIGMSGTSDTTFTVSEIRICKAGPVPEPLTMFAVTAGIACIGAYVRRRQLV